MRILIFQHVPFETPGTLIDWAGSKEHEVDVYHAYKATYEPDIAQADMVISLGGPMGVYELQQYPYLQREVGYLQKSIKEGKILLGICLGAQLLAHALGAKVYRHVHPEIGWYPIQWKPASFLTTPSYTNWVLHWHSDTFDLPTGAQLLASSEACENQAFTLGKNVMGLQFHLEVSPQWLYGVLEHEATSLVPARYVQPQENLLKNLAYSTACKSTLFQILDELTGATSFSSGA
jgi:GMP synthase-like glutamine amidotransferase